MFKLYGPFTDADPSTDACVDPDPANNVAGNLVTTIIVDSLGSPDASGNYVVSSGEHPEDARPKKEPNGTRAIWFRSAKPYCRRFWAFLRRVRQKSCNPTNEWYD